MTDYLNTQSEGPLPIISERETERASCPVCGHPTLVRDGRLCGHGPSGQGVMGMYAGACPGSGTGVRT